MKSRHNRVQVSVLAVVLVLSVAGWAAAQNPAVHGTGTPGTIPLWTSSDTIGNSSITQSSSGDQTINGSLSVNGSLFLPATTDPTTGVISIGGLPVLHTFGRMNTFVGPSAGNFTMTGPDNTAVGFDALYSNTTGAFNTATGIRALISNTTGNVNTATGSQ